MIALYLARVRGRTDERVGALPELFVWRLQEIRIPAELEVEDSVYAFEVQLTTFEFVALKGSWTHGGPYDCCMCGGGGGWVGPLFGSSTHAFSG